MNAQTAGTRLRRRGLFFLWPFAGVFLLVLVGVLITSIVAASLGVAPWSVYPRPFFFPFGFLVPLVIFGLFGLFWRFSPWRRRYYPAYWHYRDDAHAILRHRYARGEITKDQFEQMRRDLEERK